MTYDDLRRAERIAAARAGRNPTAQDLATLAQLRHLLSLTAAANLDRSDDTLDIIIIENEVTVVD